LEAFKFNVDKDGCIELLRTPIANTGRLEDTQLRSGSSNITSWAQYIDVPSKKITSKVSMDGKGRALTTFYIGTFLKVIKYERYNLNPPNGVWNLLSNGRELYRVL